MVYRLHAYGYCLIRAVLMAVLLYFAFASQRALAAESITIHTEKHGSAVTIEARALLVAPLPLIWATLTDYDHFSTFIPGMHVSRVIERRVPVVIVKQQGEAGFLFFTRSIDVVVESLEKPPHAIEIRALSGNLRKLEGRYRIEPVANTTGRFVLHWSGVIEPQDSLPPLIGLPILRANISDQFRGMVREIARRAELSPVVVDK